MSSTGTISRVITSTTNMGERERVASNNQIEPHNKIDRAVGLVSHVHPEKPRLVKAYNETDYSPLANGDWILLNHSAQEIAERWGTVRPGFRIQVTFAGPSGAKADGTIIGAENQNIEEPPVANEVARGLFALFAPGIGG